MSRCSGRELTPCVCKARRSVPRRCSQCNIRKNPDPEVLAIVFPNGGANMRDCQQSIFHACGFKGSVLWIKKQIMVELRPRKTIIFDRFLLLLNCLYYGGQTKFKGFSSFSTRKNIGGQNATQACFVVLNHKKHCIIHRAQERPCRKNDGTSYAS